MLTRADGARPPGALPDEAAREAYVHAAAGLAPGYLVMLASFDGDELVAAVQLDRAEIGNGRRRGEVRGLVVSAERSGTGIGRALLEAVVECGRSLDLRLLCRRTRAPTRRTRAPTRSESTSVSAGRASA